MLYFLISSLIFDKAHSQGVFIEVDDICIGTCVAQKDWKFNGNCPQTHCDYQCAAQRLAHQIGHRDGTEYHCALNYHNRSENRQTWAEVQNCKKGEQPYVMLYGNTIELPTSKWMIVCDKCNDNMYYNSDESTSSNTYNTCTFEKKNRCTPENHKINCGIPWEERTESDGYCRCDYEQGYAPFNGDVSMCFYSEEECEIKKCPPGKELVSNYSCVLICPQGYYRDKSSRECSPIISPFVTIPSVPPTTRNTTVQTPSRSTHGPPVVTFPSTSTVCCKRGPAGSYLFGNLIVQHRRDSTYSDNRHNRDITYSAVNREPETQQPQCQTSNGASGGGSGNSKASDPINQSHIVTIHVQGDYIQTENGIVNFKTLGPGGRNDHSGQEQQTDFERIELNNEITMIDKTADATPKIDRRGNQESKGSDPVKYGVCPEEKEDLSLISTQQSSSLQQLNQNDLDSENDVNVNQEITDQELSLISNYVGIEWQRLLIDLKITQTKIDHIRDDHPYHVQDQIRHGLMMWRDQDMNKGRSRDSLIRELIDAAKKVHNADLEEILHNILGKPLNGQSDISGGDDGISYSEQSKSVSQLMQNEQSKVEIQTPENNDEGHCDDSLRISSEQTMSMPNTPSQNKEQNEKDKEKSVGVTEHGEDDEKSGLYTSDEGMEKMQWVGSGLSKTVSPVHDISLGMNVQMDKPEVTFDEFKERIAYDILKEVIRKQCYTDCNWPAVLKWLQETSQTSGVELKELLRFPTKIVSHTQIKKERQDCKGVPSQFTAYRTSGKENSCLYQSVSVLLCGDEGLQYRLRLAAFVFIIQNVNDYVQQVIEYSKLDKKKEKQVVEHFLQSDVCLESSQVSNMSEGIEIGMNRLVKETPELGVDSSSFHVDFLCGALQRNIESFYSTELVSNTSFIPWIPIIKGLTTSGQQLHIFWTSFSGDSGRLDHIVPLFKIE